MVHRYALVGAQAMVTNDTVVPSSSRSVFTRIKPDSAGDAR